MPQATAADAVPSGSTALSAGLIPAAGTRFQRAKRITDSFECFVADIQRKADGESAPAVLESGAIGGRAGFTVGAVK
jgi:fumarate reductase flavoprotein subunit